MVGFGNWKCLQKDPPEHQIQIPTSATFINNYVILRTFIGAQLEGQQAAMTTLFPLRRH